MSALEDALEQREPGLLVGAFKGQAQCGAADHSGVKRVGAVGNHNKRNRCGAGRQLIDLLDQYIDARTILMMRLHLAPACGEIVRLVDNEDGPAYGGSTRLGLRKSL